MTFSSVIVVLRVVLSNDVTSSKVLLLWSSVFANSPPVMGSKVFTWDKFVSSNDDTSAKSCKKTHKNYMDFQVKLLQL